MVANSHWQLPMYCQWLLIVFSYSLNSSDSHSHFSMLDIVDAIVGKCHQSLETVRINMIGRDV